METADPAYFHVMNGMTIPFSWNENGINEFHTKTTHNRATENGDNLLGSYDFIQIKYASVLIPSRVSNNSDQTTQILSMGYGDCLI